MALIGYAEADFHSMRTRGHHYVDRTSFIVEMESLGNRNLLFTRPRRFGKSRTSMDLPIAQKVIKAVQNSTTEKVILMPSAGGSLPLYLFEQVLKTPPLTVPVVNYDNNQHGENENLRIGCLFDGIETMAAIMLLK